MPRNLLRPVMAVLVLAAVGLALAAAEDRTWVKLRYEVEASSGVPSASYTIIETLAESRSQRARVLFTAGEQRLVIDLRVKEARGEGDPDSRWADIRVLGTGDVVSLALVGEQAEIFVGGRLALAIARDEPLDEELRPAAEELRAGLSPDLADALDAFCRIGIGRESSFVLEANALAEVLFPEALTLPYAPGARRQVQALTGFEPAKHKPVGPEKAFGSFYTLPGKAGAES